MRRSITTIAILLFVGSGIACACPSEISIEDHTSHQSQHHTVPSPQADCCDDCDDMSATKQHGNSMYITTEKFSDVEIKPAIRHAYEIFWDENPAAQQSFVHWIYPPPHPTPVNFFDRMLD